MIARYHRQLESEFHLEATFNDATYPAHSDHETIDESETARDAHGPFKLVLKADYWKNGRCAPEGHILNPLTGRPGDYVKKSVFKNKHSDWWANLLYLEIDPLDMFYHLKYKGVWASHDRETKAAADYAMMNCAGIIEDDYCVENALQDRKKNIYRYDKFPASRWFQEGADPAPHMCQMAYKR